MGNFNEIVPRRLNISPAREATLAEAQTAPVPFDKYYAIRPTRVIEKLKSYFILPATRAVGFSEYLYFGRLLFQYNVTAPAPFFILTPPQDDQFFPCVLAVKWRNGTNVHRYFLKGAQQLKSLVTPPFDVHNTTAFPIYANQEVPVNCVFEVWSDPYFSFALDTPCGLANDFKLEISYRPDPSTPDDIELDITVGAAVDILTSQHTTFPIVYPLNAWPAVPWLDNP